MASLRPFLLALALVLAQLAAGAHAVDHGLGKDGALPLHACQLCLSAHDLGSALPTVPVLPPVVEVLLTPETVSFAARAYLPPPPASQRAPPSA